MPASLAIKASARRLKVIVVLGTDALAGLKFREPVPPMTILAIDVEGTTHLTRLRPLLRRELDAPIPQGEMGQPSACPIGTFQVAGADRLE